MTSHVELPALESVTVRTAPGFVAVAVHSATFFALLATAVWFVLEARHSPPPANDVAALSIVFLAGVLGLWLLTNPFFDSCWSTDSEGLTISRTWKPRRILWSQVSSVETRWINLFLGRRFVLTTGTGAVFVPSTYPDLTASMWLHLNRVGMTPGLKLENDAESLLTPVDPTVPDEVEWVNRRPPSIVKISVFAAITITALVLLKCFVHSRAPVYFGTIFLTVILDSARLGLTMARRCVARSDRFEADTILRKVRVRWEDVKSAQWNDTRSGVRLRMSWYSSVFLPWDRHEEESHVLFAAIAKHLRNRTPQLMLTIPRTEEEAQQ